MPGNKFVPDYDVLSEPLIEEIANRDSFSAIKSFADSQSSEKRYEWYQYVIKNIDNPNFDADLALYYIPQFENGSVSVEIHGHDANKDYLMSLTSDQEALDKFLSDKGYSDLTGKSYDELNVIMGEFLNPGDSVSDPGVQDETADTQPVAQLEDKIIASSETGVLDADPSLSGAMHYEGDFGGNVIYYDEAQTYEAIAYITNCCVHIGDFLEKVSNASEPFAGIARPYDKLVSSMSSFDYSRLSKDLEAAKAECLTKIDRVVGAIRDYADGDGISNESIGILNEWIKKSPTAITPFGGDPNSGPGADPTIEPIFGEDNPDLNKEPENPTDSDDILVLPGNSGNGIINHGSTVSAILGGVGAGASLLADDNLSEVSSMDDIQTSLLGSLDSGFIVPSPKTTVGEMDGVKSSGAIGAVGAVIATGAALGGKIYYDKKKESDQESNSEESEEFALGSEDEQKNVDLEEIKTSDGEMDFRVDGVQFKENLFNLVGGENNE